MRAEKNVKMGRTWRSPLLILALVMLTIVFVQRLNAQDEDAPTTGPASTQPVIMSDAELKALAAELRAAYEKSPDQWPAAEVDAAVKVIELGLLPPVEHPESNPYSKEKVDLGRELFFSPKLSGSGQFACASCHNPELGWGDGITASFGHDRQLNKRNAPTIMNTAFSPKLFHDGRADSLEDQVLGPIVAENEMHADPEVVVKRVQEDAELAPMFKKAFGDDTIDMDRIAKAIACFERTVVGGRSRFDLFLRGRGNALTDDAIRGLHLFRTKAGCMNCHHGPNFTDNLFHDVGLSYYGRKLQDLGRYEITKDPKDVGAFRTPTLRNIERTGPYMHNGLFELDGVLNLYNAGMPTLKRAERFKDDPLFPTKSHLLKPLKLTRQEIADLKAFLLSLTEPKQRVRVVD